MGAGLAKRGGVRSLVGEFGLVIWYLGFLVFCSVPSIGLDEYRGGGCFSCMGLNTFEVLVGVESVCYLQSMSNHNQGGSAW